MLIWKTIRLPLTRDIGGPAGLTPAKHPPEMMKTVVQIRDLSRPDEFERCVELQKIIWGFEYRDVVPARLMIVAQQQGGLAMGAFDGEKIIGFVFAIPSLHGGRLAQHSHMLGVLSEYRDRGVGRMLKLAQYRDARQRRIPVITWTFDPLETKNAFFNLNRLGVVCNRYYVNLYGEHTTSELHSGLGTDRFVVEWGIGGERAERILAGADPTPAEFEALPRVLAWSEGKRLVPREPRLDHGQAQLLVEAPPDTQRLKRMDRDAAAGWREATRVVFLHYFGRGYWIKALARSQDVLPIPEYSLRRAYYLLERHED